MRYSKCIGCALAGIIVYYTVPSERNGVLTVNNCIQSLSYLAVIKFDAHEITSNYFILG